MLAACNTTKKNVETQSEQLATRMAQLQQRGYMYGHQDDPMYGLTWKGTYAGDSAELGRSDVLELVGDYPGVMGFDLGGIEMGDARNLDSVPFQRIHDELVAHVQRGGIVTLSWHPRNPLTGSNAWDVSDTTVVRNCLPGGSVHEKFKTWMQRVGDFIETLKDDQGHSSGVSTSSRRYDCAPARSVLTKKGRKFAVSGLKKKFMNSTAISRASIALLLLRYRKPSFMSDKADLRVRGSSRTCSRIRRKVSDIPEMMKHIPTRKNSVCTGIAE